MELLGLVVFGLLCATAIWFGATMNAIKISLKDIRWYLRELHEALVEDEETEE